MKIVLISIHVLDTYICRIWDQSTVDVLQVMTCAQKRGRWSIEVNPPSWLFRILSRKHFSHRCRAVSVPSVYMKAQSTTLCKMTVDLTRKIDLFLAGLLFNHDAFLLNKNASPGKHFSCRWPDYIADNTGLLGIVVWLGISVIIRSANTFFVVINVILTNKISYNVAGNFSLIFCILQIFNITIFFFYNIVLIEIKSNTF